MKNQPTLVERIDAELADGPVEYHALMRRVFPESEYPNAFRRSNNGGPPGCAMAFGAALRRGGFVDYVSNDCFRMVRRPLVRRAP